MTVGTAALVYFPFLFVFFSDVGLGGNVAATKRSGGPFLVSSLGRIRKILLSFPCFLKTG
jgi:hypothetical protein